MKVHHLKHVLYSTSLIALLVAPILIIGGALVGLGFYTLTEYQETAQWICGIAFVASIILGPIAAKVFSKPAITIVEAEASSSSSHTACDNVAMKAISKNQRRHPRYRVNCAATFSNEYLSGFGMIRDVSLSGCRLKSKLTVTLGDSGKILIDIPGSPAAIQIANGVVRWVKGSECGIEFIDIGTDEQRFRQRITEMPRNGKITEAEAIVGR